jgi:hypothetical protein
MFNLKYLFFKCWNKIQDHVDESSKDILNSCKQFENEIIPKLENIIKEETNAKDKLLADKKKFDASLNTV